LQSPWLSLVFLIQAPCVLHTHTHLCWSPVYCVVIFITLACGLWLVTACQRCRDGDPACRGERHRDARVRHLAPPPGEEQCTAETQAAQDTTATRRGQGRGTGGQAEGWMQGSRIYSCTHTYIYICCAWKLFDLRSH
jgi:hypothetical protein